MTRRLIRTVILLLTFLLVAATAHAASCDRVTTPMGTVAICGHTITATSSISHQSARTTDSNKWDNLGWWWRGGGSAVGAKALFKVGADYVVPIEAGIAGSCNMAGGLYLAILGSDGNMEISPYLGPPDGDTCLLSANITEADGGLLISIAKREEVAIYRWRYQDRTLTSLATEVPRVPDGYTLLASVGAFGTPTASGIPLTKRVATRYGELAFATEHHPAMPGIGPAFDFISGLSLAGVDVPEDKLVSHPEGFASQVLQVGQDDVVAVEGRPDEIAGEVFQIIAIGPQHIHFSPSFGTYFGFIAYRQEGDRFGFAVADYASTTKSKAKHEGISVDDAINVAGIIFRYFTYQGNQLNAEEDVYVLPADIGGGGVIARPTDSGLASTTTPPVASTPSGLAVTDIAAFWTPGGIGIDMQSSICVPAVDVRLKNTSTSDLSTLFLNVDFLDPVAKIVFTSGVGMVKSLPAGYSTTVRVMGLKGFIEQDPGLCTFGRPPPQLEAVVKGGAAGDETEIARAELRGVFYPGWGLVVGTGGQTVPEFGSPAAGSGGASPSPPPEPEVEAGTPSEPRLGPSFDCAKANARLAQVICASPDLSRLDLEFAQAYYALRQQVGEAGRAGLMEEAAAFQAEVLRTCQVPASGPPPTGGLALTACITQEYRRQREAWLDRLSGPAREEATRPIDQHVALQRDLQALGFLPPTAAIDGVYGTATRAAIVAWQQAQHEPPSGFISETDAAAIEGQGSAAK